MKITKIDLLYCDPVEWRSACVEKGAGDHRYAVYTQTREFMEMEKWHYLMEALHRLHLPC